VSAKQFVFRLTPGEPRLHRWCDRCQTSAGYEVDLLWLGDDGVSRFGTARRCRRCDDLPDDDASHRTV
jgi:hypothetical protein